jgi:hypothetical protein
MAETVKTGEKYNGVARVPMRDSTKPGTWPPAWLKPPQPSQAAQTHTENPSTEPTPKVTVQAPADPWDQVRADAVLEQVERLCDAALDDITASPAAKLAATLSIPLATLRPLTDLGHILRARALIKGRRGAVEVCRQVARDHYSRQDPLLWDEPSSLSALSAGWHAPPEPELLAHACFPLASSD